LKQSRAQNFIIPIGDHPSVKNSSWTGDNIFLSKVRTDDIKKFETGGTDVRSLINGIRNTFIVFHDEIDWLNEIGMIGPMGKK